MSSTTRAWVAAACVGTVEVLKDQGYARWNHALRCLQQQGKRNFGSYGQGKRLAPSIAKRLEGDEKSKQSEESLRKVMYLSCWGPN
ncbi:hypothetical protein H6P81_005688 [Aristolochia fimbriata]|uniref:Wound-responsive family protein n=1 Tax=Aristolochia fimbriata TaxID=158543 RepID=A0AAV7EWK1_ARIFI|nr:hypothetical protein H6P81_005688 [Aristolochia fimbriata]